MCSSRGVEKKLRKPPPSCEVLDTLPSMVLDTIAEALPLYERMHALRIRPSGRFTSPTTREVLAAPETVP